MSILTDREQTVQYLDHIIEGGNIQPSQYETKAVANFRKPRSARDVLSFLSLTGYFRKFVYYCETVVRFTEKECSSLNSSCVSKKRLKG